MNAGTMADERIYTVNEVADILRLHPRTVRRMIADGEIRAFQIRGEYRIRQRALDAVMRDGDERKKEDQDPGS